jgi:hypothetical protein
VVSHLDTITRTAIVTSTSEYLSPTIDLLYAIVVLGFDRICYPCSTILIPGPPRKFRHTLEAKAIGVDCVLSNPKAPFGAVMSAELSICRVLIPAIFDPAGCQISESGYGATLSLKGNPIIVRFDLPMSGTEAETYYCLWLETSYDPEYVDALEDNEKEHILILKRMQASAVLTGE